MPEAQSKFQIRRQAVVVIHGIGEQCPMDTLRSLVDGVYNIDPAEISAPDKPPPYYSRPDLFADNLELRCLTISKRRSRMTWSHCRKPGVSFPRPCGPNAAPTGAPGWSPISSHWAPHSHATLLLAANESDFQRKVRQFEMPSCPPLPDHRGQITQEIQYKLKDGSPRTLRVLQHAALFAVTRWTNLYFPARRLIEGDFVGGPIAPVFGRGVKDCSLVTKVWAGMLSHTHYWTKQSLMSLQALREAMDVRCKVLRETIQKRHDD